MEANNITSTGSRRKRLNQKKQFDTRVLPSDRLKLLIIKIWLKERKNCNAKTNTKRHIVMLSYIYPVPFLGSTSSLFSLHRHPFLTNPP